MWGSQARMNYAAKASYYLACRAFVMYKVFPPQYVQKIPRITAVQGYSQADF
jgi:hypothetical protein